MKSSLTIIAFGVAIFFFASCKKENTKDLSPDTNTSNYSNYGSVNSTCSVAYVDTASFDPSNKISDAPIDPVISGSSQAIIAKNNYERIQWCLTKYKKALLKNTGIFFINKTLILENATLISASVGVSWPVIKMAIPSDGQVNGVIKIYNNSRMAFVTVNGNNFSLNRPNAAIVSLFGNNSKVDNNWIIGGDNLLQKDNLEKITGVYILCGENNIIQNNKITKNHYGVIVFNEVSNITSNIIDQNDIYNNRCDGLTLRKYAKITNNKIHLNGWDCLNNLNDRNHPIPGGGIYSLNNLEGAYIKGNEIYDNNGNNIDLINVKNFSILSNVLYNPGNKNFPGCGYPMDSTPVSGAAFSMSLVNIANSTIEGNNVRNENRSSNSVNSGYYGFDPNRFFSAWNGPKFSDLPFNGNSVIAFCLAETEPSLFSLYYTEEVVQVKQNIIRNNIFIASPNGIGYFSSRNTGFEKNQYWSSETTNYFTLNNPNGSNHGSVRCGGNWYAANNIDHNTDDVQHVPPASNWAGSDNKNFY